MEKISTTHALDLLKDGEIGLSQYKIVKTV